MKPTHKGYYKLPNWDRLCITYLYYEWVYVADGEVQHGHPSNEVLGRKDFMRCNKFAETVTEKENEMKDVNYIGGDYKVVEVSYELNEPMINSYYFKCDIEVEVKEGAIICVESKRGLELVKVIKCFDNCIENADLVKKAKAWVVDKIDYSRQQARKEATEKREYILQQLEEKKKAMEAINMYALLAETDPEAKKLVEELKQLGA